ncbi:MAG: 3-ketoacyl-ACP reductase [Phycisphaeraceae bacterium]|nr:3-ketoacyl-ACP reductase [Phycisphaeraceae bacterium]
MNTKVALVTGGTRGIGLGIATQLAQAGYDLALNGMRPQVDVQNVIDALKQRGHDVIYCQADIGSPASRQQMLETLKDHYGGLHCLINNAGVAPKERADILEATEASFDFVVNTNLKGPYFLTQAVANWMIQQKQTQPEMEASIINVASISSDMASINRGDYCVSKAGLTMMTKLFATRLGEHNIPVYEVSPGIIQTDMTAGVKAKYDKLFADGLAIQPRWGMPKDVGKAVASLARGDFPYSSGQIFRIDGGLTVPRL